MIVGARRRASDVEPFRIAEPHLVRRGRRRRALRDVSSDGDDLPAELARSRRPRLPHARRRLSERRVGERVQRLLELVELARDEGEALLPLGRAVQALELVGDPVEALEQGVELAISDVVLLHEAILRPDGSGGRRACGRRSRRTERREQPLERAGAGLERATRRVAPSCASATRASGSGASVKTPSAHPAARASGSAALVAASRRRYAGA